MRVALIAPPWLPVPPPAYGGTEAVVDRLARGLDRAGHEVLLVTTGDSTCAVPRAVALERAIGVGNPDRELERRYLRAAYAATSGFDIVHDHTVSGPAYAAEALDQRVVTTAHGPLGGELHDRYRAIADRVAIIAISHAQAASAPDLPIACVIHHGLDLEDYPLGTGQGGYFLFLGRMSPDKGVHRAALAAREAGVRLLIAAKMSEPHEHRYFEETVRPLLGDQIEYVGEVRQREKLALLAGARALLNPISWPEPFGLVMIEALACGTPVLAFPKGAAPEIVEHGVTGFLCKDVHDLTSRLEEVGALDRSACREIARARFSTERMVTKHVELFTRLVDDATLAA